MNAVDMALAHHIARAIHERQGTPNQPDQLGKDMAKAYDILEMIACAGLMVVDPQNSKYLGVPAVPMERGA